MAFALSIVALFIWIYLIAGRGWFWLAAERDDREVPAEPATWPSVIAIVPARNEADVIRQSIGSLACQDYPGSFRILLVDDESEDGTAQEARAAGAPQLTIIGGAPRPKEWTGKLWALQQGLDHVRAEQADPAFLWFTDADIAHAPDNLRQLVARAEADDRVLVSLMARLHCRGFWERLLIPAFVFFFEMLYPFRWVNNVNHSLGAAAGGCVLLRRQAFERAGGLDPIKSEIIDDCALGRLMKTQGPIWLGLTRRAISIRPYDGLGEIRQMVARSAYAQLGYNPLALLATVAGLTITYLVAPVLTFVGPGLVHLFAGCAWALMTLSFVPMLRFYGSSILWAPTLPIIACFYMLFTLDSGLQHWRGRGGMWKGRAQAASSS